MRIATLTTTRDDEKRRIPPIGNYEAGGARLIGVDGIREYEGNPRRLFRGIEELAIALERDGQLEPIVVREVGDLGKAVRFEIADGARRLRAARLAKIPFLRAEVRELTDREMVEFALGTNVDRESLHPIEEAEGYRDLYRLHGMTVAEIAARRGVPERRVHARMLLVDLHPDVKKAFESDRFGVQAAMRLARLAPEVQCRAWADLAARSGGGVVGELELRGYLSARVFLVLARAPFPLSDPTLVPAARACLACPKTTQRQHELFEELATSGENACTDPTCWATKRDAQVARLRTSARFLDPAEARDCFTPGTSLLSPEWVEVDRPAGIFARPGPKAEPRSLVEIVGEKRVSSSLAVVLDREGNPRQVVPADDAWTMLRDTGNRAIGDRLPTRTGEQRAEARKRSEKELLEERERIARSEAESAVAVLSARAASLGKQLPIPDDFWRWLLLAVIRLSSASTVARVFRRRELVADEDSAIRPTRGDMERVILAEPNAQRCRAIAVEVAASSDGYSEHPVVFRRAFEALGVDLPAARKGQFEVDPKFGKRKR